MIATLSNLSLTNYEQIRRAFPPPGHCQPKVPTSSSILASSSCSIESPPWAEDVRSSSYRWAPIWSALGKGKGRAGHTMPVDQLSAESEAVCDELGWHFVARFRDKWDGQTDNNLERDLRAIVRFPGDAGSNAPRVHEMIHPLPSATRRGGRAGHAYLIFPHGTQVLQPAFDRILAAYEPQADKTVLRRTSLRHATVKDLHLLLKQYEDRFSRQRVNTGQGPDVAVAVADPYAYPWQNHTFSGPTFFTAEDATAAKARNESTLNGVEENWWKPAYQLARALAWIRYLSLLPTWPTAPTYRSKSASWRSVLGSLPNTLAFDARHSELRPTRVHLSGLPPRFKTSLLTKHLRARPDYGTWVNLIRRAPTERTIALIRDAKDEGGLRSLRRILRGDRDGVDGRQQAQNWTGQAVVGASIEKLPSVLHDRTLSFDSFG